MTSSHDAHTPLMSFQQVLRQRQEMEDNKNPVRKGKVLRCAVDSPKVQ